MSSFLKTGGFLDDYRLELASVRAEIENAQRLIATNPLVAMAAGTNNKLVKLKAREAELVSLAGESKNAALANQVIKASMVAVGISAFVIGTSWGISVIKNRSLAAQIQREELKRLRRSP